MEKLKMHSPNLTESNIAKLAELFPNCVTETKNPSGELTKSIDFDLLKQELSSAIVEGPQERYQLNWPGKREALLTANAPIAKTLRPCREESVDFDTTENLFIEGDNLDALKLLQETYLGKVKMIYIDPPYNTGKDFIYEDDFAENTEAFLKRSNQKDEDGNRMVANTESNGRFHSDWLSMMYPRLKLARNLLRDDGVIFISIDDNEVHNLRKLCDEVFGGENFVANIVWQKKYGPANDAKGISQTHEHLLVFGKQSENWIPGILPRNEDQLKAFKNPDNDPRGRWRSSDFSVRTYNEKCVYEITGPNGDIFLPPASRSWVVSKEKYAELLDDNRITFGTAGIGRPMQKKFLSEVRDGITPETWWDREKVGDNKIARYEMKALFPENVFDTPKPTKLISYASKIANLNKNDIILDFFAGSATTAHAVMQLNAEDGGKRKFIMVQLPEPCDEKSEAFKAGYKTIAEISKERIRRAGARIKTETEKLKAEKESKEGTLFSDSENSSFRSQPSPLDTGFRVLKVADSNMVNLYYQPDKWDQDMLAKAIGNIKHDRTSEDLLFQVILDWGTDLLTKQIERVMISGNEVFFVDGNALAACFEKDGKITEDFCKELAGRQPLRVVFRDAGFENDSVKINVGQIFKLMSPHTDVKTI